MITVTDKSETLLAGIGKMIDAMVLDYSKGNTNERMFNEYKDGFKTIVGQKFIKVTNNGSVKAFVVKADDGRFKMGDILNCLLYTSDAADE